METALAGRDGILSGALAPEGSPLRPQQQLKGTMKPDRANPKSAALRALAVAAVTSMLLLTAALGIARAQEARAKTAPGPELWLFFSPASGDLSKELRAADAALKDHPEIRFRAVLLVPDLAAIEKPTGEFAATIKELRSLKNLASLSGLGPELRILDDEGLVAARTFGVEAVPAWVYIDAPDRSGGRAARAATGAGANVKGLIPCK